MNKKILTWAEARNLALELAERMANDYPEKRAICGVPRGGHFAALLIAVAGYHHIVDTPDEADIVVDDIIDSGKTREGWIAKTGKTFYALVDKLDPTQGYGELWVVFPWERGDEGEGGEDNVRRLLQVIGEDPDREGLRETPKRFIKSLKELCAGYQETPANHLTKSFDVKDADVGVGSYDQLIMSGPLPFTSLCEHHLALFEGHAWLAYIPSLSKGRVVGLSKLARLLDGYAKRLQVQERLTMQIANDMEGVLKPEGVAVVIRARHTCQCARGVRKDGRMLTSAMRGVFKTSESARNEFLQLTRLIG